MQEQIEAVLVCCTHYDAIMNFQYSNTDYITKELLHLYQDYLFEVEVENQKNVNIAKQLDQVMYVYITTKRFFRFVQTYFLEEKSTTFVEILDIIALYHDYIKEEMNETVDTKWI